MKKKMKTLVLALMMVFVLPLGATAQGLFQLNGTLDEVYYGTGNAEKQEGLLGMRGSGEVDMTGGIAIQGFGQEAPVGSGIVMLVLAGAGYAAIKRKEEQQ